jgi:hypothetical protein
MEPGVGESGPATHQVEPGIAAGAAEQHLSSRLIGPGSLIDTACLAAQPDTTLVFEKGISSVSANSESLAFNVWIDGAGNASRYRK